MPRRLPSRPWAILVLAAALGVLPLAAHALPGPGLQLHAILRLEARDWLSHLGRLLDNLWNKATAETGVSIDPNGQPTSAPGTDPTASEDTGKSIDPNG
jgi:hypothetical protein